eukprot:scaffold32705_cov76-Cyclotella_meneghiniana.AAC.1
MFSVSRFLLRNVEQHITLFDKAREAKNAARRLQYCIERCDGASPEMIQRGTQAVKFTRSTEYFAKRDLHNALLQYWRGFNRNESRFCTGK